MSEIKKAYYGISEVAKHCSIEGSQIVYWLKDPVIKKILGPIKMQGNRKKFSVDQLLVFMTAAKLYHSEEYTRKGIANRLSKGHGCLSFNKDVMKNLLKLIKNDEKGANTEENLIVVNSWLIDVMQASDYTLADIKITISDLKRLYAAHNGGLALANCDPTLRGLTASELIDFIATLIDERSIVISNE